MADGKPLVAVVGATSKQGFGVARALQADGRFLVRALTRSADREEARVLTSLGVQLTIGDSAKKDDLLHAFQGAYGVFAMTPMTNDIGGTAQFRAQKEFEQAKLIAEAADEAGVRVFVFAGDEDSSKLSKGKFMVPEYDSKAWVPPYVKNNLQRLAAAYVYLPFFYTNFMQFYHPKKSEDGAVVFRLPLRAQQVLPWIDPYTAIGPIVAAICADIEKYRDQVIPIVNELLTPVQMVEQFTEVTGLPARYEEITMEEFGAMPALGETIVTLYKFTAEFGVFAPGRDLGLSRKIDPAAKTWKQFLKQSGWDGEKPFQAVKSRLLEP